MTACSACLQALQDRTAAQDAKTRETQAQLSTERDRAEAAEQRGRALERQLAEQQQDSERLLKKEDADAELAAQVYVCRQQQTGLTVCLRFKLTLPVGLDRCIRCTPCCNV